MIRAISSMLFLCISPYAYAQSKWPITRLDEHVTIEMPYEGTVEEDEKQPEIQRHWTSTSDNEFQAFRVDLLRTPGYIPGLVPNPTGLSKLYDKASRQYNRQVIKGKLLSQSNIVYAGTPARAAIYRGFNEFHQKSTCTQIIWIWYSDALYLFTCSYILPETEGAIADKNRFFSSVRFNQEIPVKDL